jgi:Family of unknown function (DUF6319)
VPPRKKTPATPPLTEGDLADLAFRLKGGDTPRVVVRTASASVPAGTRGNVVRLGKPSDGEYIVVRLGRDEVPFAPSELSLPTRGRAGKPAASLPPAAKKTAAATARSTTTKSASATSKSAAKSAAGSGAKATRAAPAKKQPARPPAERATPAARTSKRSAGRRSKRAPQPLTVTLRFSDSRWSVEAQRGSRRLAKSSPLRPGAVSAFAEHVDDEAVREALVETVESCRAVVEERAEALRAELQAAETTLREYDARRR